MLTSTGRTLKIVACLQRFIPLTCGLLLGIVPLDAQQGTDLESLRAQITADPAAVLQKALTLSDEGEWEQSSLILEELLAIPGGLDRTGRSQARKFLGVNRILLGKDTEAVQAFKHLVEDDPQFGMDDLAIGGETPSEVVRFFGQAVLEVRREELAQRTAQLSQTSRGSAFMRSALLPGWGQRYQGYRGRSLVMLGLTAASIGYAVSSEFAFRSARDDYRKAADGAEFEALYAEYTSKADRADRALGIVAAVWAYNMIDALVQGPNLTNIRQQSALSVAPRSAGGIQVALFKAF